VGSYYHSKSVSEGHKILGDTGILKRSAVEMSRGCTLEGTR
jgi:hypothetical protein